MQDEKCRWHNKGFCLKGLAGTKCELEDCVAHVKEED
jgi:hypothetical protein